MGWQARVCTSPVETNPKTRPAPPPPERERSTVGLRSPHRRLGIAGAIAAIGLTALMARFPPAEYSYLPACPIHGATGLYCPGCGTARALGALLTGDLRAALDHNLLMVVLLPLFVLIVVLQLLSLVRDNQFRELPLPRWILAAMLVAMLGFAVARNLPFAWAQYLAP